jgi:hypothetical protein
MDSGEVIFAKVTDVIGKTGMYTKLTSYITLSTILPILSKTNEFRIA